MGRRGKKSFLKSDFCAARGGGNYFSGSNPPFLRGGLTLLKSERFFPGGGDLFLGHLEIFARGLFLEK